MATWTTLRNMDIDEASAADRGYQILTFFDKHLVDTAGWTRVATSNGTAYTWGTSSQMPVYPSIVGMSTDSWGVWENSDGAQMCVKSESTVSMEFWFSPGGNFIDDAAVNATTPPSETAAAPADMITAPTTNWNGLYPFKLTLAYSGDDNSIYVFGRRGSGTIYDELSLIVAKVEDVKSGDVWPTYVPYWFYSRAGSGTDVWEYTFLSEGSNTPGWGLHPTQGVQEYYVIEPQVETSHIMESAPVDPISGNSQRMSCVLGCTKPSAFHIRGTVPGLFRISPAVHNSGDRLDDAGGGVYDWVVMGDYAVPWFSSDALLW